MWTANIYGLIVDSHPAVFSVASDTSPETVLFNYGAVGAMSVLLIYVVKKLYENVTQSFEQRLADKDSIIANRDATIAKQDTIISMFLQQGQQAVPALARTAQVIEAVSKSPPPPADLEDVKQVLPRLLEALERLESHGEAP